MLVKPISNLFDLMDFFVRARQPLSVREIVDEFRWPRSSVFNMVSIMVEHGYLYQPVPRGGYYPTSKWSEFSREVLASQPLPESVHNLLVELMHQTGETMILAGPEGTSVVLQDVVESPEDIRYMVNVGQRLPIHLTAAGRAILAQYSPAERAATLKRINYEGFENSGLMSPDAVEEEIQHSMKKGWFINMEGYQSGVAGIAVPFRFGHRRNAIVLGAPVSRIEKRLNLLGKRIEDAVKTYLSGFDE